VVAAPQGHTRGSPQAPLPRNNGCRWSGVQHRGQCRTGWTMSMQAARFTDTVRLASRRHVPGPPSRKFWQRLHRSIRGLCRLRHRCALRGPRATTAVLCMFRRIGRRRDESDQRCGAITVLQDRRLVDGGTVEAAMSERSLPLRGRTGGNGTCGSGSELKWCCRCCWCCGGRRRRIGTEYISLQLSDISSSRRDYGILFSP
jgi:hypothetical protein